ncbi:hypothetical protein E8E11_009658 [Didymella keratinophila]|nr:hypothetical protein E8E11_009658 [Didymella keratinophila]
MESPFSLHNVSGRERPTASPQIDGMKPEVQETRLVIGLDYGTTFTGVAFATPTGDKCTLSEITVITDWGTQMSNHDKVPSVKSYSVPSVNREQQWGSSLSPNAVSMVHTKLELGPQDLDGELDMTLQVLDGMKNLNFNQMMILNEGEQRPAYSHKTPEEIVTDYLTNIFEYLDRSVSHLSESFRKYTSTDIVVTVPTDWPYIAKNSTYRAITKAGFNRSNFPRLKDVMFMTESEAAALYTARFFRDERGQEFLRANQYFILVDAGGGTVDIVSYQVKRLYPLQLEQIGRPTGAKCGSIFINRAFKRWLRSQLGDEHYTKLDPNMEIDHDSSHSSETPAMRDLMQRFDERKQAFTRESRDQYLDLPFPLENLNVPGVINEGQITITRSLMEDFFDSCIDVIVEMVKWHMERIAERGSRPKDVFLVGGFGASDYLKHHLEVTVGLWNINFRTPHTSWTAVVQGAVVCGIEKASITNMKKTTFCRQSYAVCLDESFTERFDIRDRYQTESGAYAKDQLSWLLNKGDLVVEHESRTEIKEFDICFPRNKQTAIKIPVYSCQEEEQDRPTSLKFARDDSPSFSTMAGVEINAQYVLTNGLLGADSVLASTSSNDSAIISSKSETEDAQTWFFSQPTSASYYRLHTVEKGEGYALDIRNYYGDSTMDLRFFAIQDRTGQYWHLDKRDDGSVKLSSEFQPDLYLDVVKDDLQPTLRATDSPGQHWTLSRVGSSPTSSATTSACKQDPIMNPNNLMVRAAGVGVDGLAEFDGRASLSGDSWLSNQTKLEQLHQLRTMALGNAKILYGSEKFKFFDVVIAYSEPNTMFAAVLVCSFNDATKILRKEVAACPLAAARAIVHRLHVDSGLLLTKYDVGDQIFGQQGGTPRDGEFGLHEWKRAVNDPGQDQDDVSSLVRGGFSAPTAPRADRQSYKRSRRDTDRGGDYWDRDSTEGRLRYDN